MSKPTPLFKFREPFFRLDQVNAVYIDSDKPAQIDNEWILPKKEIGGADAVTLFSETNGNSDGIVDIADAASRLLIEHINSIGTENPGKTTNLRPDSQNSAILNPIQKVFIMPGIGLCEEVQSGFPPIPSYIPIPIERVYDYFYLYRSSVYACRELGLDMKDMEHCFHGHLVRVVHEDCPMPNQDERIYALGHGFLRCLPIMQGNELAALCACDELGNVFALMQFRLGMDSPVYLPFKPSHPGFGPLRPEWERTPEIILEANPLAVLYRQDLKLTYVNLCNLKNMDWTVLRGHSCAIIVRTNDGLNEWQRAERLLSILASAEEQGIKLGVIVESSMIDNEETVVNLSFVSHDDYIHDCKMKGMTIPPVLLPHSLIQDSSQSPSQVQGVMPFGANGPLTAFEIKTKPASWGLERILKSIVESGSRVLIIVQEDSVFEMIRLVEKKMSGCKNSVRITTTREITSQELFNRAAYEADAQVVFVYGLDSMEDCKYLQQISQWRDDRELPVCFGFYNKDGALDRSEYDKFDDVYELKNETDARMIVMRKHPVASSQNGLWTTCYIDCDGTTEWPEEKGKKPGNP